MEMMEKIRMPRRIKFWQFIDEHPQFLTDLPFTDAEKSYIYNWFFHREVDEEDFGRMFIITVQRYWHDFQRLKAIDLNDQLLSTVTNKRVREMANQATNSLSRSSNTTTNKTTETSQTIEGTTNNKQADRALPMNSYGDDLDDIVDWSKGASTAGENKGSSLSEVNGGDTIRGTDIQSLNDIGNQSSLGTITDTETNELVADIMTRIWNYIVDHDVMDWLLRQLQVCFVHKINLEEL